MKEGYHLNSFQTKGSLRKMLHDLEIYNQAINYELATRGNELSQLRADVRRLQAQVTDNALLVTELDGQVRVQANIVTSANLAKQEALKQYQAAYQRAENLQTYVYKLGEELQQAREPHSLFDRIFGRD